MSHWKGFKIKAWANPRTTPSRLDDTGYWRPMATKSPQQHGGCTEENANVELEASIREMKWETGNMAAVRWGWTTQGPQTGRRETQKGHLSHVPSHILVPSRSASKYLGKAAEPKASFGYFVDRKAPLAEQARRTIRSAVFQKLRKGNNILKTSLVRFEVSTKIIPLEKSANDTLRWGMRWVQIACRTELASRNRTVCDKTVTLHLPTQVPHADTETHGQADPPFEWGFHCRGQAFTRRVFRTMSPREDSILSSRKFF